MPAAKKTAKKTASKTTGNSARKTARAPAKRAPAKRATPVSDDDFVYPTSAGTLRLPKLTSVKFGTMRRLRKLSEQEQVYVLIEEVCGDDELAVVDELKQDEIASLIEAWAEASGANLGESSASSTSSSSTARLSSVT